MYAIIIPLTTPMFTAVPERLLDQTIRTVNRHVICYVERLFEVGCVMT